MKNWLAVLVVLAGVVGLTASGAKSDPQPDLIAKPGDLYFLAGSNPRKVCAANEATPRKMKSGQSKVKTFACWSTTSRGRPIPDSRVVFVWAWRDRGENKSLAGYTNWNATATKFARPAANAVFTLDKGWPAKYVKDPFAVTESQRLGRKAKTWLLEQSLGMSLIDSSFEISCSYDSWDSGSPNSMGCLALERQSQSSKKTVGFGVIAPGQNENVVVIYFDPICSCGQKAWP